VAFSARAVERVRQRSTPVPSWYFDVSLLSAYYGAERVYHHTAPISMIFGLAEALRVVDEEGMPAREARHRAAAAALIERLDGLGFTPLVAPELRLPPLTTLRLPEAVLTLGEAPLRKRLLEDHDIEVGGGLGKLAGAVWRVGLMGENARIENVERLGRALETLLRA
jgi:alanine-glyoxylate transaminase/serine-glyoxylate transaminase/serine-pyruvate transaminase